MFLKEIISFALAMALVVATAVADPIRKIY